MQNAARSPQSDAFRLAQRLLSLTLHFSDIHHQRIKRPSMARLCGEPVSTRDTLLKTFNIS